MIRRSGSALLLTSVLTLGTWGSLVAQSTWRVDSLMTTWPVATRMEEVRSTLSHGVIRIIDTHDLDARLIRVAGELPVFSDSTVEEYIHVYGEPRREQFRALLGMAQAYFPMIEAEFAAQGIPQELKYLPMAMSAMNVQGASTTGEAGLWMLTWPVALRYGLVVTAEVDERNDARKSTAAAARYLKDLYTRYGTWETAAMAFACGPANVTRAHERDPSAKNVGALYPHMSESHRDVLPMLMAFVYLSTEAKEQGIEAIAMHPSEAADTVSDARALRFDALAAVMGTPIRHLRAINPTLIAPTIPAGQRFCVPAGDRARFAQLVDSVQRLDQSLAAARATLVPHVADEGTTTMVDKIVRYKVRSGDNLGAIAQRHNVTVSQLKKWNHLRSDRIAAGAYLDIHVKSREKVKAPVEVADPIPETEGPTNRAQPATDATHAANASVTEHLTDPISYTVQPGDSLYRIAKRYPGLTAQRIMEVNGIGTSIRPGQKLKIPTRP
ncbi:MAG: LysM peptidoglycan-binding domain-containing protein [Flavobacteriales bacterium]